MIFDVKTITKTKFILKQKYLTGGFHIPSHRDSRNIGSYVSLLSSMIFWNLLYLNLAPNLFNSTESEYLTILLMTIS